MGLWMEEYMYFFMETDQVIGVAVGTLTFILTFRLCKFTSISPRLAVPFNTLVYSMSDLGAFCITLMLFTLAFLFLFMFNFGATIDEFSGMGETLLTLGYGLVGEFTFDAFDNDPRNYEYGMFCMFMCVPYRALCLPLSSIPCREPQFTPDSWPLVGTWASLVFSS